MIDKLTSMYTSRQWCDLEVTTDNIGCDVKARLVPCHKNIVSAGNGYFRDLLDSQDSSVMKVQLPITVNGSDSLEIAIGYIYTGTCDVTEENAHDLLVIGRTLYMNDLTNCVSMFIKDKLTIDNVLKYHEEAMSTFNKILAPKTSYYIRMHFMRLWKKFDRLSLSSVYIIFESDCIQVDDQTICEDIIFQCVSKFIDEDIADVDYKQLISLIRFEHITDNFFETEVRDHQRITIHKRFNRVKRWWPGRNETTSNGIVELAESSTHSDNYEEDEDKWNELKSTISNLTVIQSEHKCDSVSNDDGMYQSSANGMANAAVGNYNVKYDDSDELKSASSKPMGITSESKLPNRIASARPYTRDKIVVSNNNDITEINVIQVVIYTAICLTFNVQFENWPFLNIRMYIKTYHIQPYMYI